MMKIEQNKTKRLFELGYQGIQEDIKKLTIISQTAIDSGRVIDEIMGVP